MQRLTHEIRAGDSEQHARRAADQAEHDGLAQELELDGFFGRPHGHADADLPRALRDRNQHHVHDADSAHEQRNRRDRDEKDRQRLAGIELGLNDVFGIADVEVVFFLGAQMVPIPEERRRPPVRRS